MKAPASKATKTGKSAASGATARATKPSAPAKKAAVKAPAKAVKPASKTAAKPATKPAAKAAPRPAPKPAAKTASKTTTKPVAKAPVKTTTKPAAKPVAPATSKSVTKPTSKPAAKAAAKAPAKAVVQPVAKAAAPKSTASAPTPATRAAKAATALISKVAATPAAPARPVIEPTPRPMGKREAKKMMMEQMTQAEVVPTHASDAPKATFSHMNERAVMTPPVPSSIQKDPKRANNWKTLSLDQLTDLDVQAMPDSEYMSDLQLAYFRRKLTQLKADMLANAGETTEHLREDTVVVPDPADRATIEEEHALELRTRDRERKLLKKIEQAIARIDSGDYGYCEETGEPIGVGRLMARPTASLSLEAQQRRELKQKMFGD